MTFLRFFSTGHEDQESIKWGEVKMLDRCQQIVAKDYAHPDAIGLVIADGPNHSFGLRCLSKNPMTSGRRSRCLG